MTKQEQTAMNMAEKKKKHTLILLEKLNDLDLDSCATDCEELNDVAEKLYIKLKHTLESQ